jgi:hypothetical protein
VRAVPIIVALVTTPLDGYHVLAPDSIMPTKQRKAVCDYAAARGLRQAPPKRTPT